jgi:hypothetical protein
VLPDPKAWVDPGNLYALSTAMHFVFNIIETDPADEGQVIYFRVPPAFGMVGISNLRAQSGYVDASYVRKEGMIEITVSGTGDGKIVVVGAAGADRVTRDGTPWEEWVSDGTGDIIITSDLENRSFTITPRKD